MTLFRSEAISYQSKRLSGNISLALPTSWQAIGYLLTGILAATALFMALANYSRVETASGKLVPDKGLITVIPTRAGTLSRLDVAEGQEVQAGAELASIGVAEAQANGHTATQDMQQALDQQMVSLAAKENDEASSFSAQRAQLSAQESGMADQIAQDDAQITLQKAMVGSAQDDLNAAQSIADKGFISKQDLRARENTLLQRQQQLAQLRATRDNLNASLAMARHNEAQLVAQAASTQQGAALNRAELQQQKANLNGQGAYVLRAPVGGEVTALVAKPGEAVSTDRPLLQIVPKGSRLLVQLMIGSNAIGFVAPGQEVHLAVDAFPFEKFGSVKGHIVSVAKSPVSEVNANGQTIFVYPAIANLDVNAIYAFGKMQPLVPGMTLNARIITDHQSLLQWLFEPIFAVWRR